MFNKLQVNLISTLILVWCFSQYNKITLPSIYLFKVDFDRAICNLFTSYPHGVYSNSIFIGYCLQSVCIQDFDSPSRQLNVPFVREVLEHPGYDLPCGAHVSRHLVMGEEDRAASAPFGFAQEEDGKPPVEAHEDDLSHHPDDVREVVERFPIGEVLDMDISVADPLEDVWLDDQDLTVLLGIDVDVECDILQDTGGGKDADVSFIQPIERDLATLF